MASIYINNFIGGINESVSSNLIQPNEAANCQNCNVDDGTLTTAKGTVVYLAPPATGAIKTLMNYYLNGNNHLIAASGGKLYRYNGVSWDTIATGLGSDSWDYVNDNYNGSDVIVMTNGFDNAKIYDGVTFRDLKHDGKDSTPSETNVVNGKYIDLHFERLWVSDDYNLYFSTSNKDGFDIEDFTAPTAPLEQVNNHGGQIFMYTNDGSKISSIHVVFNDILVFMEKQVFKIFGYDVTSYQKNQLFSSSGAIADKSIAVTPKRCFYINIDGIYFYDGSNVNLISQKIKKTFATLNQAYIHNATAIFFNNKYILAVPEGSSTTNNLIIEFDTQNNTFMFRRGFDVYSFVIYKNLLLYVGSNNYIYQYDVGTTYSGGLINSSWTSGFGTHDTPEAVKEVERVYVTASGNGNLRLSITTEKGTKEKIIALGSNDNVYPVNMVHRGRLISIGVDNPGGGTFKVKDIKLIVDVDED